MSKQTERVSVFDNKVLTVPGITTFSTEFPLGQIWTSLILRLRLSLTIGTGTGALAEALQRVVENILLTTDIDGNCINCPARPLYRSAQIMRGGTPPIQDSFAATTGTYTIEIPILFADPRMERPQNTALDTSRYSGIQLQITMGGVSRLLSTPGTATYTATMDVDIERYPGEATPEELPVAYPYKVAKSSVNPNNQQFIDLERAEDLWYKRLFLFTTDNTDQWQGAADSAVLNKISIEDENGFVGLRAVKDDILQGTNVSDYSIDGGVAITGLYIMDWVLGRDIEGGEPGEKDRFQVTWTNDTPAGRFVHVFIDGVKRFK
jgi:hypothetical protein